MRLGAFCGRRYDHTSCGEERHKMACPYKEVADTAARIAQTLEARQMLRERLQCVRVEILKAYPRVVGPLGEAVDTAQQVRDPVGMVARVSSQLRKASR